MIQFQLFDVPKYMMIGLIAFMIIILPLAMIDAQNQKEELSNMSCLELNEYLIEKAFGIGGFQGIAEKLYKYKCVVPIK